MLTSNVTETSGSSSTNTSAVTYTYDAIGNLVATTDSVKQEEATYQYDPQGQMVSYEAKKDGNVVATQKNAYNGNGQRILKKDGNKKEESYILVKELKVESKVFPIFYGKKPKQRYMLQKLEFLLDQRCLEKQKQVILKHIVIVRK